MDGTDNDISWKDQKNDTSDTDTRHIYDDLMTFEQAIQLINETDSEHEFKGRQ